MCKMVQDMEWLTEFLGVLCHFGITILSDDDWWYVISMEKPSGISVYLLDMIWMIRCELRASWCQVLQPSTGGNQYLEFYPPWALVKRDTEWRWVCFAFITAHGRGVSLDEVLARVRNRRGVCLCGNKSMQCFDYVYH